jgi:hypothetical protein
MGPEFLVAGLITFQLALRAGLSGSRNNNDCCERKNISIESRFHRVTPCAAVRPRLLLVLHAFERRALVWWKMDQTLKSYHIFRKREARAAQLDCTPNKLRRNFFKLRSAGVIYIPCIAMQYRAASAVTETRFALPVTEINSKRVADIFQHVASARSVRPQKRKAR